MIFQQLINDEAGCLSYLIGCARAGAAMIVDPGRDRVSDYIALARRKGLTITHIVETHLHADHVSGNQALAAQTGATICMHAAAEARFRHLPVEHDPAHGAGSACGRAMSSKAGSTIGFERRFNPALRVRDAEEFVRNLLAGLPPQPPNFKTIIERNRSVAPLTLPEPRALSAYD